MAFKIGAYTFAMMHGLVPQVDQAIEQIETPGEDLYILRKLGTRTEAFEVLTQGAYPDELNARVDYDNMTDLIGDVAQSFEKDDINYTTENIKYNYKVHVLDLAPPRIRKMGCITGTDHTWLMQIQWTLILTPFTAP